jgi:hypothetical protein
MPTLFQCDSCHIYLIDEHTTTIWKSDKIYYKHTKLLQGSKKITMKLYKWHQEMKHVIRRSQGLSSGCKESNSDGKTWVRHLELVCQMFPSEFDLLNSLLKPQYFVTAPFFFLLFVRLHLLLSSHCMIMTSICTFHGIVVHCIQSTNCHLIVLLSKPLISSKTTVQVDAWTNC